VVFRLVFLDCHLGLCIFSDLLLRKLLAGGCLLLIDLLLIVSLRRSSAASRPARLTPLVSLPVWPHSAVVHAMKP
jgi:hypothetical protein